MNISNKTKHTLLILTLLLSASAISSALVVFRYYYTGYLSYHFLIWNLFLAWIPLGAAAFVRVVKPPLLILLAIGAVWLLFFPNAPYILTDLIHLNRTQAYRWLDLAIVLSFAVTGLFAGYASLAWMQEEVRERIGNITSWFFVITVLAASGFGVYIGRFLRWNSWDAFTRPEILIKSIISQFTSPHLAVHTWGLSIFFALVFIFCYVMAVALPQVTAAPQKA